MKEYMQKSISINGQGAGKAIDDIDDIRGLASGSFSSKTFSLCVSSQC